MFATLQREFPVVRASELLAIANVEYLELAVQLDQRLRVAVEVRVTFVARIAVDDERVGGDLARPRPYCALRLESIVPTYMPPSCSTRAIPATAARAISPSPWYSTFQAITASKLRAANGSA